jgi:hypothetical protein
LIPKSGEQSDDDDVSGFFNGEKFFEFFKPAVSQFSTTFSGVFEVRFHQTRWLSGPSLTYIARSALYIAREIHWSNK